MSALRIVVLLLVVVFILPALATAAWWMLQDRPGSWRNADWSSSGILPSATDDPEAVIHVMAARTGGLKGAFSVHSWIVFKKRGEPYQRFDKVGWGSPIRRNSYAPDGRWYSNVPTIVHSVYGAEAERLIPAVEAAIRDYPYGRSGDYRIWPGPNSNSFVAHVVRSVPDLGAAMPPNATGRDYAPGFAAFDWLPEGGFHATLGGIAGITAGLRSGIEFHFIGLVAGIDFADPALLVPAYGRVELSASS